MKKSCNNCCLTCPVLALALLRIIVAVIFLMAGISKVTDISSFMGMVEGFGYPGVSVAVVAWFVAVVEVLGGVALLAQKWMPKCLGKMLILLLIPVIGGMIYHVNIPAVQADPNNMTSLLLHVQLIAAVYVLASMCPKCPLGLSGSKSMDGSCPVKKGKK